MTDKMPTNDRINMIAEMRRHYRKSRFQRFIDAVKSILAKLLKP